MTTKLRIIIGFMIMIALSGVLAFMGYMDLQNSSDNFVSYRKLARLNVAASDTVSTINRVLADINEYDSTENPEVLKDAEARLTDMSNLIKEAQLWQRSEADAKVLASAEAGVPKLRQFLTDIQTNINAVMEEYDKEVQPTLRNLSDRILAIGDMAYSLDNKEALHMVAGAMDAIAAARSSIGRFSESRTPVDAERSRQTMKEAELALNKLEPTLQSMEGRRVFGEAKKAYEVAAATLEDMIRRCALLDESKAQDAALTKQLIDSLTAISAEADTSMRAQGTATLDSNADAQKVTLITSAAILIVGVLLALFIIYSLVKILAELARYANSIAEGDFEHELEAHEKGEVGRMIDSMHQIPEALKAILAEYQGLEQSVEAGQLDIQGDPSKYKGEFATLVRGTNGILGRFRMVLENIPSPVVILDKDLKASYLNAVAREVAGSDYTGKTCKQLFGRDDFGTNADALKIAVESRQRASAETMAHPQGKDMDISYTAIPMLDAQGRIASVMQLITDLTAIKDTQRKIMAVAAQAADISNRVAAASEQLSAQVEQVSRGAEMQRSRVESTASAMTEMNSTVLEVARSAGQASEQSELTRRKANDGDGLVNKVVQSINQVNQVASTLQGNMQELGGQAESIGGVMNVISDIADQTNLLALNAAIEAARAGEAGRGFAVVADEVRKLAEKTMSATHEVGSSITAIQNSARTNIEEVSRAAKAVTEATELANSSGTALKEIVDLASANSSVVASIATAAEEQSATSEEINRAVEEINHIVGETSDGMVQASSAVSELSQMAQQLRRVMEELR